MCIAPPINIPVRAAISSPPIDESRSIVANTLVSMLFELMESIKDLSLKPYLFIPNSIISIFLCSLISFRPAPRPVTFATGKLKRTDDRADEVVVFPIPISPVPMIFTPLLFRFSTISIPVSIALKLISGGIAFSFTKLLVPCISL